MTWSPKSHTFHPATSAQSPSSTWPVCQSPGVAEAEHAAASAPALGVPGGDDVIEQALRKLRISADAPDAIQDAVPKEGEAPEVSPLLTLPNDAQPSFSDSFPSTTLSAPVDRPLRVALLGLGTVGGGVWQVLQAAPSRFTVVGIAVRDPQKYIAQGSPASLLTDEAHRLIRRDVDVVVELMGGIQPAKALLCRALEQGCHVVSANKDLIARYGGWLRTLARANHVSLRYAASVGGGVPMIETVEALRGERPLRAIRGVLNGTTNFILDRLAQGDDFDDAVLAAQEAGFAEADPSSDLSGADAAYKLAILAFHGFGQNLLHTSIPRVGIEAIDRARVLKAKAEGKVIRLVASCEIGAQGLQCEVKPVWLSASEPLAQVSGAGNLLEIEAQDGHIVRVEGQGAGRWPTASSVCADLDVISAAHWRQGRGAHIDAA